MRGEEGWKYMYISKLALLLLFLPPPPPLLMLGRATEKQYILTCISAVTHRYGLSEVLGWHVERRRAERRAVQVVQRLQALHLVLHHRDGVFEAGRLQEEEERRENRTEQSSSSY